MQDSRRQEPKNEGQCLVFGNRSFVGGLKFEDVGEGSPGVAAGFLTFGCQGKGKGAAVSQKLNKEPRTNPRQFNSKAMSQSTKGQGMAVC